MPLSRRSWAAGPAAAFAGSSAAWQGSSPGPRDAPRRKDRREAGPIRRRASGAARPGVSAAARLLRSFQDSAGDAHDLFELAESVGAVSETAAATVLSLEPLGRALEADATSALATARREGAALAGPVEKLRRSLGAAETR